MVKKKNEVPRQPAAHPEFNQTPRLTNDGAHASERLEIHATLLRVVAAVAPDRCLREDLLQEAVIHLWQLRTHRPGQSSSWYLKSCQLHLLNLLRKGRSIDSLKHRQGRVRLSDIAADVSGESGGPDDLPGDSASKDSVFDLVSARDILASLCRWLDPPDRLILAHLADGLSLREIASRLQLSHTAVSKRQRKIACVAASLGFVPASSARTAARKTPTRSLTNKRARKITRVP
jgi:RNA polymerase sigma factor (sigma-70 family)